VLQPAAAIARITTLTPIDESRLATLLRIGSPSLQGWALAHPQSLYSLGSDELVVRNETAPEPAPEGRCQAVTSDIVRKKSKREGAGRGPVSDGDK
jgi:hypothetical protein